MTLSGQDPCQEGLIYQTPWRLEGEKKSHSADGLLKRLSSRPINHSLIRAFSESAEPLLAHWRTPDSILSVLLLSTSLSLSPSLCPFISRHFLNPKILNLSNACSFERKCLQCNVMSLLLKMRNNLSIISYTIIAFSLGQCKELGYQKS